MLTWFAYAFLERRQWPSARFDGIDTAARRIWLADPYRSEAGNVAVTR
jgi:hypothetical protein